jgi:hypothetical protein
MKYTIIDDFSSRRRRMVIRRCGQPIFVCQGVSEQKVRSLCQKLEKYSNSFVDQLLTLITDLKDFGLINFYNRLFDTDLEVLYNSVKKVISTVYMYRALGLRSIIEVQIYKAMKYEAGDCYQVEKVYIGKSGCDVISYVSDTAYVRLKVEDFRPRVEYWKYSSGGFRISSWQYGTDNATLLVRAHYTRLAKALLTFSDDPILSCWHYIVRNASKLYLPQGLSQIVSMQV